MHILPRSRLLHPLLRSLLTYLLRAQHLFQFLFWLPFLLRPRLKVKVKVKVKVKAKVKLKLKLKLLFLFLFLLLLSLRDQFQFRLRDKQLHRRRLSSRKAPSIVRVPMTLANVGKISQEGSNKTEGVDSRTLKDDVAHTGQVHVDLGQ
jgi:hypothetical protein